MGTKFWIGLIATVMFIGILMNYAFLWMYLLEIKGQNYTKPWTLISAGVFTTAFTILTRVWVVIGCKWPAHFMPILGLGCLGVAFAGWLGTFHAVWLYFGVRDGMEESLTGSTLILVASIITITVSGRPEQVQKEP